MSEEMDLSSDASFMDKYSRQIGAFGLETMAKLVKLKALVVGVKGVGIEVCKNLVLAGPGEVTVYDDNPVVISDLGTNFFLTEADIGSTRGQCVVSKLQELNSSVDVNVYSGDLTEEVVAKYSVVVFTNTPKDQLLRWNAFCHAQSPPIAFINCDVRGVAGYVFSDFGEQYVVRDANGENPVTRVIKNISNDEEGIVTLVGQDEDGKMHELQESEHDGWVEISDVSGMDGIQAEPWRIKFNTRKMLRKNKDGESKEVDVFDPYSFKIGDTRGFGAYGGGGIMTQVKKPVTRSHRPLAENIPQPVAPGEYGLMFTDGAKFGRAEQLHIAFCALHDYELANGSLPPPNDAAAMDALVELAKSNNEQLKKLNADSEGSVLALEELDEDVVRNLARCAALELQPLSTFFGGVVAQEIVKCTGKFSPLNQWFHFDAFEVLPTEVPSDCAPQNNRYDHINQIFGAELSAKIQSVKTFLVGCGALGCEFLKNFALMGVACGADGLITVTDNDRIEISNLNRQFLFRQHNVGQSKSSAAAVAAVAMNSSIKILAKEDLVAPHTENIFNDGFWESLDIVTNALDNVKARQYVDSQCVFYSKPLLESGTLGTKGNVQVVIPHLTQSYTDGPEDAEGDSIPMCTLRNFPSLIEHCIEWARAQFEDRFAVPFSECAKFANDKAAQLAKIRAATIDHPNTAVGQSNTQKELEKLRELKRQIELARTMTMEGCISLAYLLFHDMFRDRILQLVHSFPEDHTLESGERFWGGAKRFPQSSSFDPTNQMHMDFLISTANMLAVNFGVQAPPETELVPADSEWRAPSKMTEVMAALNMTPPAWTPSDQKVAANDDEMKAMEEAEAADPAAAQQELASLLEELSGVDVSGLRFEPADFEKDQDLNFHIDFISAAANLRAWNYRIRQTSRHQCKMIAGKIIPAIATTTASVTGLVMVEFLKYVQNKPLEAYKDSSNNLGLNLYLLQEPMPPSKEKDEYDPIEMADVKCRPTGFSKWDKTIVNRGDITMREFMQAFKETTEGLNITLLYHKVAQQEAFPAVSGRLLYNSLEFKAETKQLYEARMDTKLTDWIKERYEIEGIEVLMPDRTYVELQASCEDDEGNPWKVPPVVFRFVQ